MSLTVAFTRTSLSGAPRLLTTTTSSTTSVPQHRHFSTGKASPESEKEEQYRLAVVAANASIPTKLNQIADRPGAKKMMKRVGRGPGSGMGKTATRGHKGQRARSGWSSRGFEGGQTPHYKRMRKFGFSNAMFARRYALVNLDRLQLWIDSGRIDATQLITLKELLKSGCVGRLRRNQKNIKLLAAGAETFTSKINIEVGQASGKAIEIINKLGGSVRLVHYNHVGIRSILHPEKFPHKPYMPPAPKRMNRKLRYPMEQPDQHPEWLAEHVSATPPPQAVAEEEQLEE
eukprot:TRINITY_DN947_c1_g1_i1.p1 TRINITY_DN947_c1_g1~~TRINITY_DN947_c1_g1_i1.p1  ORF type:complete len:288 (-),score=81.26 TRINITY_DN947_c1_g1_i1:185-1048(-)